MLRASLAVAAILAATTPLLAQEADWTEVRARRQTGDIQSVTVDVEYIAGELRVAAADGGMLYDTRLKYDAARMRPERDWSVEGNVARLDISFEGMGDDGDMDIEFEGDDHGFLELGLSPDVPTDLRLTVGAALSEVNLGGVPLTGLVYRTGASDTEIRFDAPNPAQMERLELAVGVAEFHASGLGNARFQEFEFKGAVGDVVLDFSGDWSADASGTIDMGLGSLTLAFPSDLGVRITKKGFLSALDAPGFTKVDGGWQSPGWDSASHRLEIRLVSALGSIDVRLTD
ncbi:MAG: hypothetical protein KJO06_08730 [Gemmatimonadetes bacterium]|nr:hypothetical protein [Gemmatimonadota bacterium]